MIVRALNQQTTLPQRIEKYNSLRIALMDAKAPPLEIPGEFVHIKQEIAELHRFKFDMPQSIVSYGELTSIQIIKSLRKLLPEGWYINAWQEPVEHRWDCYNATLFLEKRLGNKHFHTSVMLDPKCTSDYSQLKGFEILLSRHLKVIQIWLFITI